MLVQVSNVSHPALAGQAEQFAFAPDPCIVSTAVYIDLSHRDYFVSNAALLIVPMIGFIGSPANLRTAELKRLRKCERHRMKVDVDEATVQSDDRQSRRMRLLGQQVGNHCQR